MPDPAAPARRRRWPWVVAVLAALFLVATGIAWWTGPQQSLRRQLAGIGTPAGLTVVRTELPRDRFLKLCIDSCPHAERFWVSSLSEEATAATVEDTLRAEGYQVTRDVQPAAERGGDEPGASLAPAAPHHASGSGYQGSEFAHWFVGRRRDEVAVHVIVGEN